MIGEDVLRNRFIYHKPTGNQALKYEAIRNMCLDMALELNKICPDSRELSLALTHLDSVNFFANAAIARNTE